VMRTLATLHVPVHGRLRAVLGRLVAAQSRPRPADGVGYDHPARLRPAETKLSSQSVRVFDFRAARRDDQPTGRAEGRP